MGDPVPVLYSGPTPIHSNDNWQSHPSAGQLQALGLQPPHANEAAFVVTLNPGQYTAIVYGANGTTGIGMVEAFIP